MFLSGLDFSLERLSLADQTGGRMAKWFRALDFNTMTRVQIPLWPLAGVVLGKCLVQLLFFFFFLHMLTALLTITHVTYNKISNREEMKYICKIM